MMIYYHNIPTNPWFYISIYVFRYHSLYFPSLSVGLPADCQVLSAREWRAARHRSNSSTLTDYYARKVSFTFHGNRRDREAENRGIGETRNRTGETRSEKRRSERCSSRCGTVISVLLVKWTWKYFESADKVAAVGRSCTKKIKNKIQWHIKLDC